MVEAPSNIMHHINNVQAYNMSAYPCEVGFIHLQREVCELIIGITLEPPK